MTLGRVIPLHKAGTTGHIQEKSIQTYVQTDHNDQTPNMPMTGSLLFTTPIANSEREKTSGGDSQGYYKHAVQNGARRQYVVGKGL